MRQLLKNKYLGVGIFAIIALFAIIRSVVVRSSINKNRAFRKALVYEIRTDSRGSAGWFLYEFEYGNKLYKGSRNDNHINKSDKGTREFINSNFPVIFDSLNPNRNDILIFPEDFKKYDLAFPDNLRWVLKYENSN